MNSNGHWYKPYPVKSHNLDRLPRTEEPEKRKIPGIFLVIAILLVVLGLAIAAVPLLL
jgi:hypothetical protein